MNTEDIKRAVMQLGSNDIEGDSKVIEYLLSEKTRAKMERVAKNMTRQSQLNLIMTPGKGSASSYEKKIMIRLDPFTVYQPGATQEEMYLRLEGVLAHEVGHILYTDFNLFNEVCKAGLIAQRNIPNIAKSVNKNEVLEPISADNKELLDTIYDYIYNLNLKSMFNSIEDGGVEHLVPIDFPRCYGAICAMRNHIVDNMEEKMLADNYSVYKTQDINILEYYMTEIRHMCTIGYRREYTSTKYLSDIFSQKEIEDIERIAVYSRIATKSSAERLAISELFLEKFNDYLREKALQFYQRYMRSFNMSAEDILDMIDDETRKHSELSINVPVDPSLAGHVSPPSTSDYEMNMPQDIQDKIEEKMKERQERQENQSGSSGSQSQSSSQESSENQDGEDSSSPYDSSDETSGSDSNDENKETDSKSEEGQSDSTCPQDGESNSEGEGEYNTSSDKPDGNGKAKSSSETGENQDGEVVSSAEKSKVNKKGNAHDAEAAIKDSLSKIEKGLQKEKATSFKNGVGAGSGVAPKLESNLGDCNSITDLHKNVKTRYYASKVIKGNSYSGQEVKKRVPELTKQANAFSKKLKEVLMYRAKARRKTALKKGKINDADLYRVITDTRVFRDTIPGIVHKARICVLIDLSGSMCGEKVVDAISAAYMLAEACQRVKVPISILGHNTKDGACSLYHFVEYENCMKKEAKEKLFAAEADAANHDGLALFHSLTDLVRHQQKNEQMVMLVISDGAPAGLNYYWGDVADKDIRSIYKNFENNYKTKTIGIGIGDDVEHIPEIYDNFLLVPNVSRLGNELLKVLKDVLM